MSCDNTFWLMLQQRERELALLCAVALTPRQLRRMIGREAALLGLAATIPGALAGGTRRQVMRMRRCARLCVSS